MTRAVYERLSDWLANLSLVFLASFIIPFVLDVDSVIQIELLWGSGLTVGALTASLWMARLSSKKERRG